MSRRWFLASVALCLALAGCSKHASRTNLPCRDRTPESSDIEVAPASEPGERLVVTGGVYRRRGGPIAGATVYVYHSDASGRYMREGGDVFDPRLCGILRTDSFGQFRIRTIMPGRLEGTPHIHFEVWGKHIGHQDAVLELVEREPMMRPPRNPLQAWPGAPPPTPLLTRDSSGVYHCHWDLAVE
jgi:hypothetical protein